MTNTSNISEEPNRDNLVKSSVFIDSEQEAERHKWIESEKIGTDLGEGAIKQWVKTHWWGYLRARWLEHLQGTRFGWNWTGAILVCFTVFLNNMVNFSTGSPTASRPVRKTWISLTGPVILTWMWGRLLRFSKPST